MEIRQNVETLRVIIAYKGDVLYDFCNAKVIPEDGCYKIMSNGSIVAQVVSDNCEWYIGC